MLRRLFHHSIWAEDAIPPDDAYRNYRRVWLPLVDVLYIVGGVGLVHTPESPALTEVLRGTVTGYGWALALVALVTLVGAAFPRLWASRCSGRSASSS
jgi:hypothetical protein